MCGTFDIKYRQDDKGPLFQHVSKPFLFFSLGGKCISSLAGASGRLFLSPRLLPFLHPLATLQDLLLAATLGRPLGRSVGTRAEQQKGRRFGQQTGVPKGLLRRPLL